MWGLIYIEEEVFVFFDGFQVVEEVRYYDNGVYGDDQVGCRQRGEVGGEGGKVVLGYGELNVYFEQFIVIELEREESLLEWFWFAFIFVEFNGMVLF